MNMLIKRLDPDLPLPGYAHPGDAGLDLYARATPRCPRGSEALLPTGVAIALPAGYAAFVHPRSGLAVKHGIGVVNGPGTIDAGYRGEISVCLINLDPKTLWPSVAETASRSWSCRRCRRSRSSRSTACPVRREMSGEFGSTGGHGGAQ